MPIRGSDPASARPASDLRWSQFDARLEACLDAADGVLSVHTVRGLRSDLARFAAWCAERGVRPLPARAATVAAYIEESAAAGRSPGTVRRYLSSIASAPFGRRAEPRRAPGAGAGPDLDAAAAPDHRCGRPHDQRAQPRDARRGLRRHASPVRAVIVYLTQTSRLLIFHCRAHWAVGPSVDRPLS